jgi:tRNA pseudouridine13 synthase
MSQGELPYLTQAIPGIGGVIRETPEDFRVEELPLYLPAGQGEHLYFRVTKRGLSTPDLVTRLSSSLGVKTRCIGVAGLKDARAVTTQMVSAQGVEPDAVARLRLDDRLLGLEVLGPHRNRLRKGHHRGNRFRIVVRKVSPDAEARVPSLLEVLARRGVPNYFGPQRQGRKGLNFQLGALLLHDAARRQTMSRSKRLWYLHAYQSYLFNHVLARRLDRLDQVLTGDWAMKHDNGACFHVEEALNEQPRAERFEISPTGPLFGSRMSWATGEPGEMERTCVAALGTTPEALVEAARDCGFRGERRSLRVPLQGLEWSLTDHEVTVTFTLPPGAYATSVLRELMKNDDA